MGVRRENGTRKTENHIKENREWLDGDCGNNQGSSYRTEQDGDVALRPYVLTGTKKEDEGDGINWQEMKLITAR